MEKKKNKTGKRILIGIGVFLLFLLTVVVVFLFTALQTFKIICKDPGYTRSTFVSTVLETGQMKFLAKLALSDEEILEVVNGNKMEKMEDAVVDEGLIKIATAQGSQGESTSLDPLYNREITQQDIEVIEIPGLTYKATLMIVKDPSRVSLATIQKADGSWPEKGITLSEIAERFGALAAINGGIYSSTNNTGGYPYGVVVSNGKIVRNKPKEWKGLVLIGLTEKNILQIIDISDMKPSDVEKMVEEQGIRDAVSFQEENDSSDNNHFVQLVINGVPRDFSGSGSGLNPRTAIGQRADGSLLLLVTDGRGSNGHAGASAADLIEIMTNYGAVNAANLDGGSSTCMYYDGKYLQNSVTFYYQQSSWRLPFAFIVK